MRSENRQVEADDEDVPSFFITYRRTGVEVPAVDGLPRGFRGQLIIGEHLWPAIERGPPFRWLRPGRYQCFMDHMFSHGRVVRNGLRVQGEYSRGKHDYPRILIHAANAPRQLEGCIAPGKEITRIGVDGSRLAMMEIFRSLGGFERWRRFHLYVEGDLYAFMPDHLKPKDKVAP